MIDLQIVGAEKLDKLARELKEAARGDLRKELLKGIRDGAKPAAVAVKTAALDLPGGGQSTGLRADLARGIKVRTRTTGKNAGVRISLGTDSRHLARKVDKGSWRHPVYGNRDNWVTQTTRPGFFTGTLHLYGPRVRLKVLAAMDKIADEIRRSV